MKPKPAIFVVVLWCALLLPWRVGAAEPGIVGTWTAEQQGVRVQVFFGADGTFTRTMSDAAGTATVRGQYLQQGNMLMVQPQGEMFIQYTIRELEHDRLVLMGMDGVMLDLTRAPPGAPHIEPTKPASATGSPAAGNPVVPEWVRPGLRLTYDLITGSISGSVNGWAFDEDGNVAGRKGNRYSPEGQGHSSHGLVEAMVAGMDGHVVALSQPFYLLSAKGTSPLLKSHLDALVRVDTGGDLWMHPQKQAQMVHDHPWTGTPRPDQTMARTRTWRNGNRTWNATTIVAMGDASRTFWVYDQATGHLLYLSRISRRAPDLRDPSQPVPDAASYATFLRFVDAQQLNLPWLNAPLPEWTRGLQTLTYQGRTSVQGPGAAPGETTLSQQMEVVKRGADWLMLNSKSQTPGVPLISETKVITGPGCLPPFIVPPAALGRLRAGQEIDRDPHTGFTLRVASADPKTVTLEAEGPLQSRTFVFDRAQGVMIHNLLRERSTTSSTVVVREMRLAAKR